MSLIGADFESLHGITSLIGLTQGPSCLAHPPWQMLGVALDDTRKFTRLWAHEMLRVFHDRLISDADRTWFQNQLKVGWASGTLGPAC